MRPVLPGFLRRVGVPAGVGLVAGIVVRLVAAPIGTIPRPGASDVAAYAAVVLLLPVGLALAVAATERVPARAAGLGALAAGAGMAGALAAMPNPRSALFLAAGLPVAVLVAAVLAAALVRLRRR